LWRDQDHAAEAAAALRITPEDLSRFKLIDEIIPEPEGGAHNDHPAMAVTLGRVLENQLRELEGIPVARLIQQRYEKFRAMGDFAE
jgi:acetyl-CoA carboxylase carboxyl transferase subunit alpha